MSPRVEIAQRGRPLGSPLSVWIQFRLVPMLGAHLMKLLIYTLRVKREGFEAVDDLVRNDQRIILAFWHRRLLTMTLAYPWVRRFPDGTRAGVSFLSSDSKDGERSAATWRWFGASCVRGTASEDGARALVRMIRAVREGWDFGITPDGPKGPRQKLKPGVIALAKRTGAWIVPASVVYSHATELRTWDAMPIPWPFSAATIRYGAPFQVPAEASDAVEGERLEAVMNALETPSSGAGHD